MAASDLADGAARTPIDGFGDDVLAALSDAIGNIFEETAAGRVTPLHSAGMNIDATLAGNRYPTAPEDG